MADNKTHEDAALATELSSKSQGASPSRWSRIWRWVIYVLFFIMALAILIPLVGRLALDQNSISTVMNANQFLTNHALIQILIMVCVAIVIWFSWPYLFEMMGYGDFTDSDHDYHDLYLRARILIVVAYCVPTLFKLIDLLR